MPATTISIATHKGGTGKTVTSMALGAALALAGKRCLIVDLDPQGHSTLGLGVELAENEPTLRDLFTDQPLPVATLIRKTEVAGLDILPSNLRLARTAQALYARRRREELLRPALQPLKDSYDFIVIDCPPSLGVLSEMGVAAADVIIVPCQMEARAADGLIDLLEVIHDLKGEAFTSWRILLTKVDHRKTVTNDAVMVSLEPWRERIFETQIPQSEPLNQAQMKRTDIFTFSPKSPGAIAYEALAQEILKPYAQ